MENMDFTDKVMKISKYVLQICEILNNMSDKLSNYGIYNTEIKNKLCCIQVNFDLTKLDDDSYAKKHNLSGILLLCPIFEETFFSLEIVYLKNNKPYNNTYKIKSNFPTINFLNEIYNIINVKTLKIKDVDIENYTDDDNDTIIENLKDYEYYYIYKKNLELLICIKKEFTINEKNKSDLIKTLNILKKNSDKFKNNEKQGNTMKKTFNIIKKINKGLNNHFILAIIAVEKLLFLEIFNFILDKPVIDENINAFTKKYMQLSSILHKSFENYSEYSELENLIIEYINSK